jgi:hypothetical protein
MQAYVGNKLPVLFARNSTCDRGMDGVVLRMVCYCCWFLMQWWLLWLPALLLLDQVLACLPFSSLVSFWWLAFSSWSGTAPPCLDLLLLWFNPWSILDGVLVCPGAVCKNSGVLVMVQGWSSGCCFLWPCSSPPAAGSADCCGAASSLTQSDDWAACEQLGCACPSLDLIQPPGHAVYLLWTLLICTQWL